MSRHPFAAGKHSATPAAPAAPAVGRPPEPPPSTNGVTFPVQARVEHDPDMLTSHRIEPADPVTDVEFDDTEPIGPALTASLIHGALVQMMDGTELDQVAQVIAAAIRLEAERIAERERDKVLVAVRQLGDVVTTLVEALERHHTADNPNEVA